MRINISTLIYAFDACIKSCMCVLCLLDDYFSDNGVCIITLGLNYFNYLLQEKI